MNEPFDSAQVTADDEHDGALFGPELLSPQEASRLLSRSPGRLVVWIGEAGAGKTTVCTELYERQRQPVADARFAGSWTLLAFERLAHHRRTTGTSLPAVRNELDPEGREILHLALSAGEAPLHLLLADLPGEVFRRLADNQLSSDEIPWLRRAEQLVLMVDGERVRDLAARSSTLTRVRQFVERLRSAKLPAANAGLALLLTKWDLVRDDPEAVAYWDGRELELLTELRAIDPGAAALRISAIPEPARDGFVALRSWLLEIGPTHLDGFSALAPAPAFFATPGAGAPATATLPAIPTVADPSTVDKMFVLPQVEASTATALAAMKLVLLGEQATGKSSLLVALYGALVNHRAGDVQIVRTVDDVEFLSRGLEALGRRESVRRTDVDSRARLLVELAYNGSVVDIELPDRSGELLRQMVVARVWDPELRHQVAEAAGAMLFLRADQAAVGLGAPTPANGADDPVEPWSPERMPADVRAVDLLQALVEDRATELPLAVIVSAWDQAATPVARPPEWLADHVPLLAQFLASNAGQLPHAVFGVSAQGADFESGPPDGEDPWDRAFLISPDGLRGTLEEPIVWLINAAR